MCTRTEKKACFLLFNVSESIYSLDEYVCPRKIIKPVAPSYIYPINTYFRNNDAQQYAAHKTCDSLTFFPFTTFFFFFLASID